MGAGGGDAGVGGQGQHGAPDFVWTISVSAGTFRRGRDERYSHFTDEAVETFMGSAPHLWSHSSRGK